MSVPHRNNRGGAARKSFLSFGLVCVVAVGAATAQISAPGATGIDNSGNTAREKAACMSGATQQAQDTCLREATNAAADKRTGGLAGAPKPQLEANAMQRCEALGGEDHAACTARVLGYGNARGSVAGGGVIREVETVVVPPGQTEVTIEPKTDNPVLIVPTPR